MRVFQLILHEGIGGMEIVAEHLRVGLTARGNVVLTHALDQGALHAGQTNHPLRRLWNLLHALNKFRPDVIIAHSAIPNVYARALRGRTPLIAVVHSPGLDLLEPRLRKAELLMGGLANATVFVAQQAMLLYQREFPKRGGSLHWIPNGIPAPSRLPRQRTSPPRRLIAVSRLSPNKDLETTLRGFEGYAQTHPDAILDIVGDAADPEYQRKLESIIANSESLRTNCRLLGRRSDVDSLLMRADALIHASHHEAQGLVLAEAAVRGLPCVVTKEVAPAIWWAMAYREFDAGDSSDLSDKLLSMSDVDSSAALNHALRAQADLDLEMMLDRYSEVLSRVSS